MYNYRLSFYFKYCCSSAISWSFKIEDVKEKETYKKAKEILEKFDPDNSLVNVSYSHRSSVHRSRC